MTDLERVAGALPGVREPKGHDVASVEHPGLTVLQVEILAFERTWWRYAGAKETAVRENFDISSTRYYQLLNALIDLPAAYVADPMLIKRLRRLRDARRAQRTGADR